MKKSRLIWLPIGDVIPYEKNARLNDEAVPKVAESIKQFGFRSPIIVDGARMVICGHTRLEAAKQLGLSEVPVLVADDLTAEQVRAYRLADNKVAEYAKWDIGLLAEELEDLSEYEWDMSAFGFEESELYKRRAAWGHMERRCDLKRKAKVHFKGELAYASLFEVGKNGKALEEIKGDAGNIEPFADCVLDFLTKVFGANIREGNWALVTGPRRRHKEGLHFSSAVCEAVASKLGIRFYEDAVSAQDRGRIEPKFVLERDPVERNILVVDDILTTGSTLAAMRELLIGAGHAVFLIAGIKN